MSKSRKQKKITIYRGTDRIEERNIWRESGGYVFTDAARDGYYHYVGDGYSFADALEAGSRYSVRILGTQIDSWGSAEIYSEAHSAFGIELEKDFGKRPAMSWTTDVETARSFAGNSGVVFKARIEISDIVNSNWGKNEEKEVLLSKPVRAWFPRRRRRR